MSNSIRDAEDDVAGKAEAVRDLSILTSAMDKTARPLNEAASTLQEAFTQVRDLTRVLQQEETRRTQLLAKHAADVAKGHDAIMREISTRVGSSRENPPPGVTRRRHHAGLRW